MLSRSIITRISRLIRDPKKLRAAIGCRVFGQQVVPLQLGKIDNHPDLQLAHVPDRFAWNYERYKTSAHSCTEESQAAFINGNLNNAGDFVRFYFLSLVCDQIEKEGVRGDLAELGTYKGNSAFLFAELARRANRTAYLLDTFEGFSDRDLTGIDAQKKREFADTSLDAVKRLVGQKNVCFIPGYFPDTAAAIPANSSFALVHLDCDLYAPTRAGLEFFYPKLAPGGFLIAHDYSSLCWDGVENAVDEFFADKPESVVPIPDKSGSVVIRKSC